MSPIDRKKFLSPDELLAAAREVLGAAERQKIGAALAGGFAMQLYGSDRLTGDLDVVAYGNIVGFDEGDALSFGGIRSQSSTGVPVDVIVRRDDFEALYDIALIYARDVQGFPYRVIMPEYLLAMKLVAGRERDMHDVKFLIRNRAIDDDLAVGIAREQLGKLAGKELRELIKEVRLLAAAGIEE